MDLAVGAKQTWIRMDLLTREGKSKLFDKCSYPLTGLGCVTTIYTDHCTVACTAHGFKLVDFVDGLDLRSLEMLTGVSILP